MVVSWKNKNRLDSLSGKHAAILMLLSSFGETFFLNLTKGNCFCDELSRMHTIRSNTSFNGIAFAVSYMSQDRE